MMLCTGTEILKIAQSALYQHFKLGTCIYILDNPSDGGTRNKEPFVINTSDGGRLKFFVPLYVARIGRFTVRGMIDGDIGTVKHQAREWFEKVDMNNLQRNVTTLGLANDQSLPSLSTLTDNIHSIPISLQLA